MKMFWFFYAFIILGISWGYAQGNLVAAATMFAVNFILWLVPALLIFAIIRRFNKKPVPPTTPAEPPSI